MTCLRYLNPTFCVGVLNGVKQAFKIRRAGVTNLVEIKRRGSGYMFIKQAALKVILNLPQEDMVRHLAFEFFDVKTNTFCVVS